MLFNNFQNFLKKYSNLIDNQKETQKKVLEIIFQNTNLLLQKENLKINSHNKTIKIINLLSSQKFYLFKKLQETQLQEEIITQTHYKIQV